MSDEDIKEAAEWIAAEYVVRLEPYIVLSEMDIAKLESKIRSEIREMLEQ